MLAHLSVKRFKRGNIRTGELEYEPTALRWSGRNAMGDELAAPVCVVIEVGRNFVIASDGKLYPHDWPYGLTAPQVFKHAQRQWAGFQIRYLAVVDDDQEEEIVKASKKPDKEAAMEAFIGEIDRFATTLRTQEEEIEALEKDERDAKARHEDAKAATREAKEQERNTVMLFLKFVKPGSVEMMPLFDTMEPTDEEKQGVGSADWRKEPITALKLSAIATRALIGVDIVLIGQLQDRILKGADWANDLDGVTEGIAAAIEMRLRQFIEEKAGGAK